MQANQLDTCLLHVHCKYVLHIHAMKISEAVVDYTYSGRSSLTLAIMRLTKMDFVFISIAILSSATISASVTCNGELRARNVCYYARYCEQNGTFMRVY